MKTRYSKLEVEDEGIQGTALTVKESQERKIDTRQQGKKEIRGIEIEKNRRREGRQGARQFVVKCVYGFLIIFVKEARNLFFFYNSFVIYFKICYAYLL